MTEFNKTLVSTNKNGTFAGEELLREKLTDLYGNINGYAGGPSQTQLVALETLSKEVNAAETKFKVICDTDFKTINELLQKAGLKELVLKSKESFTEE